MTIKFATDAVDFEAIMLIAERAHTTMPQRKVSTYAMDISACHANGCPLKLVELLAADDTNFMHDIVGIVRHIDRDTGKLTSCFRPRFAASLSEHDPMLGKIDG